MSAARHPMAGLIASSGFASGDRIVLGHWHRSPIGPFSDVMWARPDGTRVLISPDARSEAFICAVYSFDETLTAPVVVEGGPRDVRVVAGPVALRVTAGRPRLWLPSPRPAWFTRWCEGPVARLTMGVRTYGTSPTGVREWYQASAYRPATGAEGRVDGRDLGAMADLEPPLGVGFTDPPGRPSIVSVRPLLEDRSGRLDEIVSRTR